MLARVGVVPQSIARLRLPVHIVAPWCQTASHSLFSTPQPHTPHTLQQSRPYTTANYNFKTTGFGGSQKSWYANNLDDGSDEDNDDEDKVVEDDEVEDDEQGEEDDDDDVIDDDLFGEESEDEEGREELEEEEEGGFRSTYERSQEGLEAEQPEGQFDIPNPAYEPLMNLEEFPINNVLKMGFHTKITAGGRINSFSALVVIGTGTGTAGFGYGKGATGQKATVRAYRDAQRNLVSMVRYKGVTVGGSFTCKCRRSIVKVIGHGPYGEGRVHPKMALFTEAFGLSHVTVRSLKRRTWHNMLEGVMLKMPTVRTPEHVARNLGKRFTDLSRLYGPRIVWNNRPQTMRSLF